MCESCDLSLAVRHQIFLNKSCLMLGDEQFCRLLFMGVNFNVVKSLKQTIILLALHFQFVSCGGIKILLQM